MTAPPSLQRVWRLSRQRLTDRVMVVAVGFLLLVTIVVSTAWLISSERNRVFDVESRRTALLLSVVGNHAERTLAGLEATLNGIAQEHLDRSGGGDNAHLMRALETHVRSLPVLRSLSLVDAQGTVLASSRPANLGVRLPPGLLGELRSPPRSLSVGRPLLARDFDQIGQPLEVTRNQPYALAVSRPVVRGAQALTLVALVNPDYLLLDVGPTLADVKGYALLFDDTGRILATAGESPRELDRVYPTLPALQVLRAGREAGRYRFELEGVGSFRAQFRTVDGQRLVVGVGISEAAVSARASDLTNALGWAGVVGVLAVGMSMLAALRMLRNNAAVARGLRRARDAALSANAAKSAFLANVSHEIRTPINSMLGMTELALATELTPMQREYLVLARASSTTLLQLIDDILDLSRAEAGELKLAPADFDLHRLCQLTLKKFGLQAARKNIDTRLDISPDVPALVHGDSLRIGQVLLNLIGNAMKFTDSGHIRLGVQRIPPPQAGSADALHLQFEVEDTGIGIPEHLRASIFEAFRQGDEGTSRRYGGTGLGLAISRRLVRLMGGEIAVTQRASGQGSVFRFTCALQTAAATQPAVPAPALPAAAVLLLEQPGARDILRSQLTQLGVRCADVPWRTALPATFERELDALRPGEQLALVMDARLADADLTAWLKPHASRPWRAVLLHTLHDLPDLPRVLSELPDSLPLAKPVILEDLREALALHEPAPQVPEAAAAAPAVARARGGMSVLLVEDTPMNQRLALMVLQSLGVSVDLAADGVEGVQRRVDQEYDLVLMDLQMPRMDGLEATRRIRQWEQEQGCHRVPIVAMTAHGLAQDRQACLAAGMDDFLVKPVTLADFARVIDSFHPQGASRAQPPHALASQGTELSDSPSSAAVLPDPPAPPPAALPAAGTLLDLDRAIAFMGDIDHVRQMLPLFETSLAHEVPRIREHLMAGDIAAAQRLLHPLKGFVPVFCRDAVVDEVAAVQALSKTGPLERLLPAFEHLEPTLMELLAQVRAAQADGTASR